ncbi:PKD domain-containing protein [Streptomyces sp. IBSNAI002]|uniref:PKD domain-containing protein n=1 Tax=Streptomyces sp. IBSNAI002 TaxID=3457500 RepID=UPI003FD5AFF8
MRNRRLVVSAAFVAAAFGLVPGLAHAAGPVPVGPASAGHGKAAPAVDLDKARAAAALTFASPADRTVRTVGNPPPAGRHKAAGAPAQAPAQAQAAEGNPGLAVALSGSSHTAHGLDLESTVTSAGAQLDISIAWGDGTAERVTASGSTVLNNSHSYAEVGTYTVTVSVWDATNKVSAVNTTEIVTAGADFTPHAPTRLLDTREGVGAPKAKIGRWGMTALKVGGVGKIPAGVTAVALNVTVTNTTAYGHIAVQPGKEYVEPTTSNVNYVPGQTVPNLVIVPVHEGYVHLVNNGAGSVDLIADVTGYFSRTESSGYTSLTPVRFADTREGLGTVKGQVPGYGTFGLDIADRRGVPKGATAVSLNVTVTNPKDAGHLTAFPSGQAAPSTSSVNFSAGQTVANSVIVPIGADGRISIRNGGWAPTDVVVDVVGYYSPESKAAFMPLVPNRLLDTRSWAYGPLPGRSYVPVPIYTGAPGIEGYVLNATVTNPRGDGFLSVSPDPNSWDLYENGTAGWPEPPVSSTLNWTFGATVPNLAQASAGRNNVIDFWNQGWDDIDLVVDMFGFYAKN